MKLLFFSTNMDLVDEWKCKEQEYSSEVVFDRERLKSLVDDDTIVIADYDSVAPEINQMIASNSLVTSLIVLEKTPEVITGKALISHGVKAYGNTRMLSLHYRAMVRTVAAGKIWTYPELTAYLAAQMHQEKLSIEALDLIEHRLSAKEIAVVRLVLEGLTNDAIASEIGITQRTVKAHMSSIFSKLHVNDRLSLVLLLK